MGLYTSDNICFVMQTTAEVHERLAGLRMEQEFLNDSHVEAAYDEQRVLTGPVPDTVDWRNMGAVTDVKDQVYS